MPESRSPRASCDWSPSRHAPAGLRVRGPASPLQASPLAATEAQLLEVFLRRARPASRRARQLGRAARTPGPCGL
eukprot:3258593-Alexandrium_andersonii.AAC.1